MKLCVATNAGYSFGSERKDKYERRRCLFNLLEWAAVSETCHQTAAAGYSRCGCYGILSRVPVDGSECVFLLFHPEAFDDFLAIEGIAWISSAARDRMASRVM